MKIKPRDIKGEVDGTIERRKEFRSSREKQFKMANDQRLEAARMDMHGQMRVRCIIGELHNLPRLSRPKMARTWL